MSRSKKWLMWSLFPLLGMFLVAVLWFLSASQDPDVVWVGPKSKNVRKLLVWLDTPVDPAEFTECKTVEETLNVLMDRYPADGRTVFIHADHLDIDLFSCDKFVKSPSGPTTIKQLLRQTFKEAGYENVALVVRPYQVLDVATMAFAESSIKEYNDDLNVTALDYFRHYVSELFGGEGHLPGWNPPVIYYTK